MLLYVVVIQVYNKWHRVAQRISTLLYFPAWTEGFKVNFNIFECMLLLVKF